MTVCEVMAHLKELDGQIVAITGTLSSMALGVPPDELSSSAPNSCNAPTTTLKAQIKIEQPDSHFVSNPPPGYKIDEASISAAESIMRAAQNKNPKEKVRLTVVVQGTLLVTKYGPPPREKPDRHKWYSAVLIVDSYKSIKQ
jgi:hypothetical protein